jgi:hypothetical protein
MEWFSLSDENALRQQEPRYMLLYSFLVVFICSLSQNLSYQFSNAMDQTWWTGVIQFLGEQGDESCVE